MKNIPVTAVRCFAILGHSGCGKTTLTDALLFKLGANDRLGLVSNGTSMADWTDTEKNRKITIDTKPFNGVFKAKDGAQSLMVFCDTPGYMDFYGRVIAATAASDSALIVVDATASIQIGTRKAWQRANELSLPRGVVMTGLDRENADFAKVLATMQETWGKKCIPVTLPKAGGGVVDVLNSKEDTPEIKAAMSSLMELAAETNDALLEKYLGGEALTPAELATGLKKAVLAGSLVPVFACAPLKGSGIAELLEGMIALMPSPVERKAKDAEGKEIDPSPTAPLMGFVWRTVNDPYVGQLSLVRILGGTIRSDSEVQNINHGEKERIVGLLTMNGKQQAAVTEAGAGEIVALAKLKKTKLSDTLGAGGAKVACKPMIFPAPLMSCAVRGKTRADEDKISMALTRIAEDDPTIKVERNAETHEQLIDGLGDVHLDIAVEQMKARSNVEVVLSQPKIPYRETVTVLAEGHHKHKKQTGGRGQFGEVYLRIQPRKAGDEDWFVNDTFGGSIPGNFIPAIQKGLVEGMVKGTVAGYPVTDVKVSVYDGSYHEVDSSEIAFKIAAAKAFKDAMSKARPVLLEPVMTVKITIPDCFMGDVSGDLSQRRGRIMDVGAGEGLQVITAEAPLAELLKYTAELRSMTSGQGTFEMSHNRYDIVPSNVTQKIVAAADKHVEEEEE